MLPLIAKSALDIAGIQPGTPEFFTGSVDYFHYRPLLVVFSV